MKKANQNYEQEIQLKASKMMEKRFGINPHGMHLEIYCFISDLIEAGRKLERLKSLETAFPDED